MIRTTSGLLIELTILRHFTFGSAKLAASARFDFGCDSLSFPSLLDLLGSITAEPLRRNRLVHFSEVLADRLHSD